MICNVVFLSICEILAFLFFFFLFLIRKKISNSKRVSRHFCPLLIICNRSNRVVRRKEEKIKKKKVE